MCFLWKPLCSHHHPVLTIAFSFFIELQNKLNPTSSKLHNFFKYGQSKKVHALTKYCEAHPRCISYDDPINIENL